MHGWGEQFRENWKIASRKAKTFDDTQKSLATLLKPQPDKSDFVDAVKAIPQSSRATPTHQRAAAVLKLLAQKSDLNTIRVDCLSWLATAAGKLDATSKADVSSQEALHSKTVKEIHNWADKEALVKLHKSTWSP